MGFERYLARSEGYQVGPEVRRVPGMSQRDRVKIQDAGKKSQDPATLSKEYSLPNPNPPIMEPVLWSVPDGGGGEGGAILPVPAISLCDSPLWACRWQAQALLR
eukprot:sb/3478127/